MLQKYYFLSRELFGTFRKCVWNVQLCCLYASASEIRTKEAYRYVGKTVILQQKNIKINSVMKKIKAIVGLLVLMVGQAVAQKEHLVMRFDFENVEGKNVTDTVSGITAKVMNQASVVEMGSRRVLDLGNGTGRWKASNP